MHGAWGLVDLQVVLEGCHWVRISLLHGPVYVLALTACDLCRWEMEHCDLEVVPILVVGEVVGLNMFVWLECG